MIAAPLVAVLALAAPGRAAAQPFEGVINVRMAGGARGGQPMPEIEYLTKGGNVRVNTVSPLGNVGVVAVPGEGKLYVLLDAQRMYMEQPLSPVASSLGAASRAAAGRGTAKGGSQAVRPATPPAAPPVVKRTGRKDNIAGRECEHVLVTSPEGDIDLCMARGLGPFVSPGSALGGAASASMPAWQRAVAADGGFPLRVARADGVVQLEVTKIVARKLPAASFTVPDDYVKMDRPPGGGR